MSVTAGVSEAAIAVRDKLRGKIGQTKVKRYWPGKAPEWAETPTKSSSMTSRSPPPPPSPSRRPSPPTSTTPASSPRPTTAACAASPRAAPRSSTRSAPTTAASARRRSYPPSRRRRRTTSAAMRRTMTRMLGRSGGDGFARSNCRGSRRKPHCSRTSRRRRSWMRKKKNPSTRPTPRRSRRGLPWSSRCSSPNRSGILLRNASGWKRKRGSSNNSSRRGWRNGRSRRSRSL
ncbi:microfibrillar-associated protein 1-like [Iris pallida]|uniref:Microfibrillar-associated protein 1-like n=1 Tax=Iris pallida TaxID=29817 RepID=A0AAX6DTD6_IRIPA|nr:microfibrillar-associated protein 1-like [Iris pallida]